MGTVKERRRRRVAASADLADAFPRAARYSAPPGAPAARVRELPPGDRFAYGERHLQCVWYDAALRPAALTTEDGEAVRVESPGRWNLEAGPDFLDAALVIGSGRRLAGDVEVHIRPPDWVEHGHAADPRYARLVAHVTHAPGRLARGALPPGTVQIALGPALRAAAGFSFDSIDVASYPFAARRQPQPPCAAAMAAWPPERRGAVLDAAGEERLRQKALRFAGASAHAGFAQALYENLMSVLGYKHNRLAFRRLATALPLDALRAAAGGDAFRAYALLLGVAGLLPARPAPAWDAESRAFLRRLWDTWWKERGPWEGVLMDRGAWRLSGLRPVNHPARRLAAAAHLFAESAPVERRLLDLPTAQAHAWHRQCADLLAGRGSIAYWNRRYAFGGTPASAGVELLGAGRVAAAIVNVVIPALAAAGVAVAPLLDGLAAEDESVLVRQAAHNLFGRDHNPALYRSGLRRQGLLQIFHDFCLVDRTGCRECGLVGRLG